MYVKYRTNLPFLTNPLSVISQFFADNGAKFLKTLQWQFKKDRLISI